MALPNDAQIDFAKIVHFSCIYYDIKCLGPLLNGASVALFLQMCMVAILILLNIGLLKHVTQKSYEIDEHGFISS